MQVKEIMKNKVRSILQRIKFLIFLISRILLLVVVNQQRAHPQKRSLNKTGVAGSEQSCYNFEEDNYID